MSGFTKQDLERIVAQAVQAALSAERSRVAQRPQENEAHHSMAAIDDCPTCHASYKVDQYKTDVIKKMWDQRKGLHAKCKTCGLPIKVHGRDGHTKETEDPTCPLCGSSEAEDRYVFE